MNLTIDKKMISALLNKGLSNKQKHAFFVELHLLISSGLDLKNTLELIAKGSDKAIIRTVEKLEKAVIQGLSLHDAMDRSGKFSTFEINAVKVGEETGNLRIVTRSVAEFYEKKNQLRRQFVGALTYPVLVIMVAFVVLYFMLSYVVPMFGNIFTRFDSELPESTQTILNLSNWLSGNQANLAIGVVLVLALFFILKRRPGVQEGFHRVLIRLPFFGPAIVRYHMAHFAQSMHLLLQSKVTIDRALSLTAGMISFTPVKNAIAQMLPGLIRGWSLSECMERETIFSGRVKTLISVGESVNKLDESFAHLSKQLQAEIEHQTKLVNTILEPLLITFVALIVGFILIAMYLPLFSLSTAVG